MWKFKFQSEEAKQIQTEIDYLLGEMRASHERMKMYQEEIERSKARTRLNLDEIQKLLSRK